MSEETEIIEENAEAPNPDEQSLAAMRDAVRSEIFQEETSDRKPEYVEKTDQQIVELLNLPVGQYYENGEVKGEGIAAPPISRLWSRIKYAPNIITVDQLQEFLQ